MSKKFIFITLLSTIILFVVLYLFVCGERPYRQAASKQEHLAPNSFAVWSYYDESTDSSLQIPVLAKENELYFYDADGTWEVYQTFDYDIVQVFAGDELTILTSDGKLHYSGITSATEYLPNGSAYTLETTETWLQWNNSNPFLKINGPLANDGLRAILPSQDTRIAYYGRGQCNIFQTDIEQAVYLSGSYILTNKGNVYTLGTDNSNDTSTLSMHCIDDSGSIVMIDASESSGGCIGLTSKGTVKAWCDNGWGTDVSDWENIVAIERGHNFSIGLTQNGTICVSSTGVDDSLLTELLSWENIEIIAVNRYGTVAGLAENGICHIIKLN